MKPFQGQNQWAYKTIFPVPNEAAWKTRPWPAVAALDAYRRAAVEPLTYLAPAALPLNAGYITERLRAYQEAIQAWEL